MLEISSLTKSFGGARVLDSVDFAVARGEVHALLGPNGAGKSTLIKIIAGAEIPDSGLVSVAGEVQEEFTPSAAAKVGIATVHQHLSLISSISVMDNLFYGRELTAYGLLSRRRERRCAQQILDEHHIDVDPSTIVENLPVAVRQQIEIAKIYNSSNIRVLVLDEPTASISAGDAEALFERINRLRNLGVAVVYTTHRMNEVFKVADTVTVLNSGHVSLQKPIENTSSEEIITAVSGASAVRHEATNIADRNKERPCESSQLSLRCLDLKGPQFGPISITIEPAEVVGVFGSVGSGRSSFLETIAGVFGTAGLSGTLELDGQTVLPSSPADMLKKGLRFVASDRATQGLWGGLSAYDNVLMGCFSGFAKWGFRDRSAETAAFDELATRLDLQPPIYSLHAEDFSGGNQQKMVVGRSILGTSNVRLMAMDEPTQGVDVGARTKIYEFIRRAASEFGCGMIISSSEADELIQLCDRILVFVDGRVEAEFSADEMVESRLVAAAHQFV